MEQSLYSYHLAVSVNILTRYYREGSGVFRVLPTDVPDLTPEDRVTAVAVLTFDRDSVLAYVSSKDLNFTCKPCRENLVIISTSLVR